MKILIAGPGCPKCQTTEKNVRDACEQLSLDAEVMHLSDVKEYAKHGVMLTPAVIIDSKVVSSGRVPSVDEIKNLLEA